MSVDLASTVVVDDIGGNKKMARAVVDSRHRQRDENRGGKSALNAPAFVRPKRLIGTFVPNEKVRRRVSACRAAGAGYDAGGHHATVAATG